MKFGTLSLASPFCALDPRHSELLNRLEDQIGSSIRQLPRSVEGGILVMNFRHGVPDEEALQSTFVPIEHCSIRTLETYGFQKEEAVYASQVVEDCNFPAEIWVWFCEISTNTRKCSFLKFALLSRQAPPKFDPYRYSQILN